MLSLFSKRALWMIEKSRYWHVYLFAFGVLGFGASLDFFFAGYWFQRAGAVVAGVLAFVVFFDPRTREDWQKSRDRILKRYLEDVQRQHWVSEFAIKSSVAGIGKMNEDQRHKLISDIKERKRKEHALKDWDRAERDNARRARLAQGLGIIIGTIVWGFGDIPVSVLKCGGITCSS